MSAETRRSEMYASASGPAELQGGAAVGELESPEITPKPTQEEFAHTTTEPLAHGLGVTVDDRSGGK